MEVRSQSSESEEASIAAAVSTPANIAEEFKRRGKADKARFYNISQCSLEECRYCLILAEDLGYGKTMSQTTAVEEVSRMLEPYISSPLATDD